MPEITKRFLRSLSFLSYVSRLQSAAVGVAYLVMDENCQRHRFLLPSVHGIVAEMVIR